MGRWSAVLLVGLLVQCAAQRQVARRDPDPRDHPRSIEVQGHRGARALRPENTLAGFDFALKAGADVLEMDLAVTRDDRFVVIHDLTVPPDLCQGPDGRPPPEGLAIRSLSLEEVRSFDCGCRPNPRFPGQQAVCGQRIPTFEEVLSLARIAGVFRDRPVRLNLELKTVPGRPDLGPPPERLAALLAEVLRASPVRDQVTVQCFDHRVLRAFHERMPQVPLAALLDQDRPVDLVAVARDARASILSPHHRWITAPDVRALHQAGIRVIPWTANDPADWDRLMEMGVDGVITDDPGGLVAFLRSRGLRPDPPSP